jgi:hypothetical protein
MGVSMHARFSRTENNNNNNNNNAVVTTTTTTTTTMNAEQKREAKRVLRHNGIRRILVMHVFEFIYLIPFAVDDRVGGRFANIGYVKSISYQNTQRLFIPTNIRSVFDGVFARTTHRRMRRVRSHALAQRLRRHGSIAPTTHCIARPSSLRNCLPLVSTPSRSLFVRFCSFFFFFFFFCHSLVVVYCCCCCCCDDQLACSVFRRTRCLFAAGVVGRQ